MTSTSPEKVKLVEPGSGKHKKCFHSRVHYLLYLTRFKSSNSVQQKWRKGVVSLANQAAYFGCKNTITFVSFLIRIFDPAEIFFKDKTSPENIQDSGNSRSVKISLISFSVIFSFTYFL